MRIEAVTKKRHAILDKATLLEKGIKIPGPNKFMWTETKTTNYVWINYKFYLLFWDFFQQNMGFYYILIQIL
jgi:hypothetical protein